MADRNAQNEAFNADPGLIDHNISISNSLSNFLPPPDFSSTFCSTDASFLQDSNVAGLGVMIIFNAANQSWALHAQGRVSATCPLHAEALSPLFAMHVLSSLQVHNCPCYGDNAVLMEWLTITRKLLIGVAVKWLRTSRL